MIQCCMIILYNDLAGIFKIFPGKLPPYPDHNEMSNQYMPNKDVPQWIRLKHVSIIDSHI